MWLSADEDEGTPQLDSNWEEMEYYEASKAV